ncbi:MAG: spondin domain-containing protein [Planctomycetia bacterium]|nr:spondin domain-containing protein [Planctomycetia bacterium]
MRISHVGRLAILVAGLFTGAAHGEMVQLRVTVENLAPMDSVAFAPLRFGVHAGNYDSFNNGEAASAAIISIAEGGSGSDWFPAFMAAEPSANFGSALPNPAGPLLPGGTGTTILTVDTAVNRYFTFASMVVPSNDYFIGNDSPMQYLLFDENGQLNLTEIRQQASDIWDAGSELDDPANAAFLQIGDNSLRTPQGGVVNFNFAGLDIFNGLTTAAGYSFDSQLTADQEVYRISFEVVPEPSTVVLLGLSGVGALALLHRRRR